MRSPRFLPRTVIISALALAGSLSLSARVNETQDTVERRLLQPGLGKSFPRPKDPESKEQQREEREQPFRTIRPFFPVDAREAIYWKSAISTHLSGDNGWKVHVFYMGGRSALEAYKRVGESLNEFEIKALLVANRGSSSWKKGTSESAPSGVGFDYELEDGSLRAKVQGNWIMFFSSRFDAYVIEQQRIAKETKEKELEIQKREQQGKAPESVSGF